MIFAPQLVHFSNERKWKKLTQDQRILSFIEGYQITFLRQPVQRKLLHSAKLKTNQIQLVNHKIRSMLEKGAIQKVFHSPWDFIRNFFSSRQNR